jgi:hypothetical protein
MLIAITHIHCIIAIPRLNIVVAIAWVDHIIPCKSK